MKKQKTKQGLDMIKKEISIDNINIKEISVNIKLTPMDLAIEFCEMNADKQAEFFNLIAGILKKWDDNLSFKLHAITNSDVLNSNGRNAIVSLGEYTIKNKMITNIFENNN